MKYNGENLNVSFIQNNAVELEPKYASNIALRTVLPKRIPAGFNYDEWEVWRFPRGQKPGADWKLIKEYQMCGFYTKRR